MNPLCRHHLIRVSAALVLGLSPAWLTAAHLEEIRVEGSTLDNSATLIRQSHALADAAKAFAATPGGNVNENGPLSSQLQYRGLFGPRLNVTLDGMRINSGGPNWMDPPLHYLPTPLLDSLSATPGIGSVSAGSGIGGNIQARYKSSQFTDNSEFTSLGSITANAHSVDEGYSVGGLLGLANDSHRFHITGNLDDGNDRDFGGGEVQGTSYERDFFGVGYGLRLGDHQFSFDYRRNNTGDSGNPVFPLDIRFFDSNLYHAGYQGNWGSFKVEAGLHHSEIEHGMSNFRLRPAPNFSNLPLPPFIGDDRRLVDASSDAIGYFLKASHNLVGGTITFGFDGQAGH